MKSLQIDSHGILKITSNSETQEGGIGTGLKGELDHWDGELSVAKHQPNWEHPRGTASSWTWPGNPGKRWNKKVNWSNTAEVDSIGLSNWWTLSFATSYYLRVHKIHLCHLTLTYNCCKNWRLISSPQTKMTVPIVSVDQITLDMLALHSPWRGTKQASTKNGKEGCDQGGRRKLPFLWRP